MSGATRLPIWTGILVVAMIGVTKVHAQEHYIPPGTVIVPQFHKTPAIVERGFDIEQHVANLPNTLPNIMVTGYWPPTNWMLIHFNPNPLYNDGPWVGENWEGRGYNIYAFFAEYGWMLDKGVGDFEVDYQDTSADFWYYADVVRPIALITTGRADADHDWELEDRHRNRFAWYDDYLSPYTPTPNPPDDSIPINDARYSSLPMQEIVDAVNAADLAYAYIDEGYGGDFLCEYIGYHACWYHDLHSDPTDPAWNLAAGHIHVGSRVRYAEAVAAIETTLRVLANELDSSLPIRGDYDGDSDVDTVDLGLLFADMDGPNIPVPGPSADIDGDTDVDMADAMMFQAAFTG